MSRGSIGVEHSVRMVAEDQEEMWLLSIGRWREQGIFPVRISAWHHCVPMVSSKDCESQCRAGTSRTVCLPWASLAMSFFLHLGHPQLMTQRPSGMSV